MQLFGFGTSSSRLVSHHITPINAAVQSGVVQNVPVPPPPIEGSQTSDNSLLAPLSAVAHDTAATAMNAEQQLSEEEQVKLRNLCCCMPKNL